MRYIHIEVGESDEGRRVIQLYERDELDEPSRAIAGAIVLDPDDSLELTLDVALSETVVTEARLS